MYTNIQRVDIADRSMTVCPYRLFGYLANDLILECNISAGLLERGMRDDVRIKYTFEDYRILDVVMIVSMVGIGDHRPV